MNWNLMSDEWCAEAMAAMMLSGIVVSLVQRWATGFWPNADQFGTHVGVASLVFVGCWLVSLLLGAVLLWGTSENGRVPAWVHHSVLGIRGLRVCAPALILSFIQWREAPRPR